MNFSTEVSISVVIPTFEREELTARAVVSVINQTCKVNEIIVIDDGSSPESFLRLKQFLKDYDLKLIGIPHSGLPAVARNRGIEFSNSTWVAFLDSDDYWLPNKIEETLEFALEKNAEAIFTNGIYDFNGRLVRSKPNIKTGKLSGRRLRQRNYIINSSVILKRQIIEKIGGMPESHNLRGIEDYVTWLKVSEITQWYFLNSDLVVYTSDSKDSIRSENDPETYNQFFALLSYKSWKLRTGRSKNLLFRFFLKVIRLT